MGRRKTTKEFIEDARAIHGDWYDYSKTIYEIHNTKVTIVCPDHGEFQQRAKNHTAGQRCPLCARESQKNKITKPVGDFLFKLKEVHPLVTLKSEYKNTRTKVLIDFGCGHEPNWVRVHNLLRGQGCCYCRNEYLAKSTNDFEADLRKIHPLSRIESVYKNAHTKVLIDFGCGHEPNWVVPNSALSGVGCPECKESKGERKTKRFLKQNKISFIRPHSFKRCRNKNPLPFDFFLPDWRICIEYQGRQHYEPVEFFGGEKALKYRQKCDQIKRDFCKKSGIILVEIPYNDERIAQRILGAIAQRKREREQNPIQEQIISRDWGNDWNFGRQLGLF